ncbi:hypothetical protein SAMN04488078_10893 [Antarctobacter heliothermus]|uniref:Uncharacterized protein n=1 Tax=Antarctobacter heliothermus TaxID=74033 RepID=A0A239LEL4_9RHOB|nr:hypothetical protein SAMN04488078_10893 [Antarctobacter heliothermus]
MKGRASSKEFKIKALRLPRERVWSRGKSFVADALMNSECPAEIGERAVPGLWKGLCCTNRGLFGLPLSPDRLIVRPL